LPVTNKMFWRRLIGISGGISTAVALFTKL